MAASLAVYCDDTCKETAKHIRWFRGRSDRERAFWVWAGGDSPTEAWPLEWRQRQSDLERMTGFEEPTSDILEAASTRMMMLLSGGYGERVRRIPKTLREQVVAREDGRCIRCGEPGTEIDHVAGPSPELDNLQLLCDACHKDKTRAGIVRGRLSDDQIVLVKLVAARVLSDRPLLACDGLDWKTVWRAWLAEHRLLSVAKQT